MSPLVRSSRENTSSDVSVQPPELTPKTSQETKSPTVSPFEENIALKKRLVALELAEERLTEQLADAKAQTASEIQRAVNAEKRATVAEIEMNAAKARAQDRYTEKLHANNETRHLITALEKEKSERAAFLVGAKSVFAELKEEVSQLREEKANGEGSKELTAQIEVLEAGYVASQEDKKVTDKLIQQLKDDKDLSGNMMNDLKGVVSQLRQELDTERKIPKAAPDAPTEDQIQARIDAVKSEAIKNVTTAYQIKIDEANGKMKEYVEKQRSNQEQMQRQMQTKLDELRSKELALGQNVAALEAKLNFANKEIILGRQRLEIASRAMQSSPQRTAKRGPQISSEEMLDSNKRSRLDSFGASGLTTPDIQRTHSTSMSSMTAAMTNGNMVDGTQMQRQTHRMTPIQSPSRQYSFGMGAPRRQQNGLLPPAQMPPQQQREFMHQMAQNSTSSQTPRFASYNSDITGISPQLPQQIGNGRPRIDQHGNLSSYEAPAYKTYQLQQMRQQAQSQSSITLQQQMQPSPDYDPVSSMPPPGPCVVRAPSSHPPYFSAESSSFAPNFEQQNMQKQGTNHEAGKRHTPILRDTKMFPTSDGDALMSDMGAAYTNSQPVMGEGYNFNDWSSTEIEQAMRGLAQTTFIPNLPSNGTLQMPEVGKQHPQQRGYQSNNLDSSHLQMGHSKDMARGVQGLQNEPQMTQNASRSSSVLGRETRASSRSAPVPHGGPRRRTPGPTEPTNIPCVNCYRHWWEQSCDEGEPCSNCVAKGTECVRQKCFYFTTGTCDKGNKCPNVHEGDERYQDERYLVNQSKAGRRLARFGKKAEALPAPSVGQQA